MATTTTRRPRRKLGIEPKGIDLLPIISQPYSEAEEQEISEFFRQLRAENDKNPEIAALRESVARNQRKG